MARLPLTQRVAAPPLRPQRVSVRPARPVPCIGKRLRKWTYCLVNHDSGRVASGLSGRDGLVVTCVVTLRRASPPFDASQHCE